MTRIYIRRNKRNPDYWEVVGYGKVVRTMSKARAEDVAEAKRRIRAKRQKR